MAPASVAGRSGRAAAVTLLLLLAVPPAPAATVQQPPVSSNARTAATSVGAGVAQGGGTAPAAAAVSPAAAAVSPTAVATSSRAASFGSAATAGPDGCVVLTDTSSNSCAGGVCCDIKQRVRSCPGFTSAMTEINGHVGACCVVLIDKATGTPTPFCAAPTAKAGARLFPPRTAVALAPDCAALPSGAAGALACTATFGKLPHGFTIPKKDSAAAFAYGSKGPWVGGLAPCGNAAYARFAQAAVVDPETRATTFRVTCSSA
jgi:hypothetical protein